MPFAFNEDKSKRDIDMPLPVTDGGTGASSAESARQNLDVYSKQELNESFFKTASVSTNTASIGGETDLVKFLTANLPTGRTVLGILGVRINDSLSNLWSSSIREFYVSDGVFHVTVESTIANIRNISATIDYLYIDAD